MYHVEARKIIEDIPFEPQKKDVYQPQQQITTENNYIGKSETIIGGSNNNLSDDIDDFKRKIYSCDLCGIKVTSSNVLRRHKEGRKHLMRLEREGKTFECQACEVIANSQSQLDAHLRSSRHNRMNNKERPQDFITVKGLLIAILCVLCMFLTFLLVFKK